MSHTQNTIAGAIARSISHDEIVTVEVDDIETAYTDLLADDLADDADHVDYIDSERNVWVREVWATGDGDDWRVHLRCIRTDDSRARV